MVDTNNNSVPLVVDLDGTLIRTDMMWESMSRLLRRNPLAIFQILIWWGRSRAYLKSQLVKRIQIDPATLPYHEKFLAWLHQQKNTGRQIILATASDLKMAEPIARHVGVFDEVLGSDGKTNLRSENKLKVLVQKFGLRGFDYAGNSTADFAVWRGARQAIVVNASPQVLREAAKCAPLGPVFCENFSTLAVGRRVVTEVFWRSGYLTAAGAGLLLASAFPACNIAGFAWIAPAVLLLAAHGQSRAEAARVGYVGGLVFWVASLDWLLCIPATGLPILGWLALSAFLALYSALWLWLIAGTIDKCTTWAQRSLWALGGAAAWVMTEFVRSHFLTGFPWNLLGASQFKLVPLIQIASFTGVWGVSFIVAWFSLALYSAGRRIIQHPAHRYVWQTEIVLPLLCLVTLYVHGLIQSYSGAENQLLRVALMQPDIPQIAIWSEADDQKRFQQLLTQTQAAMTNAIDLVIWPESAVPFVDEDVYARINEFARFNHVWIILNAEHDTFDKAMTNNYNAAFLVDPSGNWSQAYHKRKLVIFGEYIPLIHWLPFVKYFTTITGGWTAGDKPAYFKITPDTEDSTIDANPKTIRVAGTFDLLPRRSIIASPLICFEDSFPELARNAPDNDLDFLVNLTNDGWFGKGSEQWQHAADSVFRAVENGVPLLRCANNGVTCWIDQNGRIRKLLADQTGDIHPAGTLIVDLPLPAQTGAHPSTFYQRHGDWFAWGCVAISLLQFLRFKNRQLPLKPATV